MFRYGWKIILLTLVVAVVAVWWFMATIMSSYITDKMGVNVNIGWIGIWPSKTNIHRFSIANPPGFARRTAFDAQKINIHYRFGALRGTPTEIDEIILDNVYLNIEIRNSSGSDNNWAAIGAQIPQNRGGRRVIIHKLIIRNMTVETHGKGANALGVSGTRHFDQMEFNEIDSADGFPTKELISRIFQDVGLWQYIQRLIDPAQQIKKALKPLNIF